LKISRSIVAAIREQKGRFLERDGNKGTWFDIGDKKAIEKTSQALREGQPKLRQKMVELGGTPPGSGISLEHQFGNGMYNPSGMSNPAASAVAYGDSTFGMQQMSSMQHPHMQQPQHMMVPPQQQPLMNMNEMPPPRARSNPMNPNTMNPQKTTQDLMMIQRLSLSSNPNLPPGADESVNSRLPQSQQNGGSGLEHANQDSNNVGQISAFSGYGQGNSPNNTARLNMKNLEAQAAESMSRPPSDKSHPPQQLAQPPSARRSPPVTDTGTGTNGQVRTIDRRHVFAKMKYSRPGSGRFTPRSDRSLGGVDGMPDIHMVDSTFSLLSNASASGHGSKHRDTDGPPRRSDHKMKDALSSYSDHARRDPDHAPRDAYMAVGSRRSLMSGLSRISDSSDVNSIFSDLSRKIGNVSTRSIAMSEISGIEEGYQEDLDDSFALGPAVPPSMEFAE
jgi:hypothetical protein